MAKLPWLIAIAFTGCASNAPGPSGTYELVVSGQSCNTNVERSVTISGSTVTIDYSPTYSNPTVTATDVEIDGATMSFLARFADTDPATSDTANGNEHFTLTAEGTTVSGSLDAMYNGRTGGAPFDCSALLGVDGTQATARRSL